MADHEHLDTAADEELLRNIGQGCTECFALLFRRYCRSVFAVSFRILRDRAEAEDILQEVFLAIHLQQERFDPARGNVRTWVLQFAYFKALLRRRYLNIRNFYKSEELTEVREVRRTHPSELLGMSAGEWARYVETGIGSLNAKQRQVIELVHFHGYTLRETSEIAGETLANTRNYYYRGIKALRRFLCEKVAAEKSRDLVILRNHDAYRVRS
jgi:RNA polymerase sigma-70 factor, ECF subfamily